MNLPELYASLPEQDDPERRHWAVHLALAWTLFPAATVPVLVEQAIASAGRGIEVDRRLVEAVALDLLLARAGDPA